LRDSAISGSAAAHAVPKPAGVTLLKVFVLLAMTKAPVGNSQTEAQQVRLRSDCSKSTFANGYWYVGSASITELYSGINAINGRLRRLPGIDGSRRLGHALLDDISSLPRSLCQHH
jgi:hypothetical protein